MQSIQGIYGTAFCVLRSTTLPRRTEQEAPYMLEPLVDAWEEETSADIKMHLLTSAVKLFFKRPPEMQV